MHHADGFALPTVLIASTVMLLILSSTLVLVSSAATSLRDRSYNQLAREAADSGIVMAQACLQRSSGTITWSEASPLRPNTDCNGGPACFGTSNCYVHNDSGVRTTYKVTGATLAYNSTYKVNVQATTELIRTSTSVAWKTYSTQSNSVITLRELPEISGGAGWEDAGHIAVVLTRSNQLYGFGSNLSTELILPASTAVSTPTKLPLPGGVSSVKKVATSGMGATYQCIIGSDDQAYCRGKPGAGEPSFNASNDWNKVSGWPANYLVYDIAVNGYGADAACFMVGPSATTAEAYCIGDTRWGELGNGYVCNWGVATCDYYMTNQAKRFGLPAGTYIKKVTTMNDQTCAITNTNDLYCAGLNNGGQITGSTDVVVSPVQYNVPGGRKVKDVMIAGYHDTNGQSVRVLAMDGTIWSSGWDGFGAFGIGTTGSNTRSSQTPVLFGGFGVASGTTGDQIKTKNLGSKCIDNSGWISTNGNPVLIWDCGSTDNQGQRWVYNYNTHEISNVSAGKCLDIPNANIANGALLRIWDCNASNAQRFSFTSDGFITVDANPAFCVDLPSGNTANGTQLQIYSCISGNNNQLFTPGNNINGWRAMIAGDSFFCGIRDQVASGSGMWCAGDNTWGQLGNIGTSVGGGTTGSSCTASSTPLQVQLPASEAVDWSKMSNEWMYQANSLQVITKSGKVYGSGRNQYGKLGIGSLGDSANDYRTCALRQMQLPGGVTVVKMSTRDQFSTYVVGSDANVYATGRNSNGQLGVGTTADRTVPAAILLPREQFIAY